MKKSKAIQVFAAVLVLTLLCACQKSSSSPETTRAQTVTDVTSVENTAAQGATKPYFRLSALPKLDEYKPPEEVFSRYYKEYTDELIPRGDYGELIPFRGKKLSYYLQEDPYNDVYGDGIDKNLIVYFDNTQYGLATLDGKIVVDPVYSEVFRQELDNGKFVYTLVKNNPDTTRTVSVAASDGSWVIAGDYNSGWQVSGGRIIMSVSGNKIGEDYIGGNNNTFKIFDYNGKYLFSVEDVTAVSDYSEGYAVVNKERQEGSDYKVTSWYIDINGKKAFGDYEGWVNSFENGYASITEGQSNFYIDKNGNKLLDIPLKAKSYPDRADFWRIRCKESGLAATDMYYIKGGNLYFCVDSSGVSYIFNGDGETIMKLPEIVNSIKAVNDKCICVGVEKQDGKRELQIYDRENGKKVKAIAMEIDENNNDNLYVNDSLYKDTFEISSYKKGSDSTTITLYDCVAKREVITYTTEEDIEIQRINGKFYFSKYEGDFSALYDENNKLILRINTNSTD